MGDGRERREWNKRRDGRERQERGGGESVKRDR